MVKGGVNLIENPLARDLAAQATGASGYNVGWAKALAAEAPDAVRLGAAAQR